MFWSVESELIIAGWLGAFFAVDVALRVIRWRGGRRDRAFIRRATAEGVSPVRAAYQRSHWLPDATEVALCGLLADGVVEVSDDGLVTAVESAPEPADPALRALVEALRSRAATGTRFHEVQTEGEFAAFRARVKEDVLPVKKYNGSQRVGLIWFAYPLVLGMGLHGGRSGAPAPGGIEEPEFWAGLPLLGWPVLTLWAVATWRESYTERRPRFARHCRDIADAELARAPARDRKALRLHRSRPAPPRAPGASTSGRARGEGSDDAADWTADTGGDSFDSD